jgi:hypothetical protein
MLQGHGRLFEAVGKAVPRLLIDERVYPPVRSADDLFLLLETLTDLQSTGPRKSRHLEPIAPGPDPP